MVAFKSLVTAVLWEDSAWGFIFLLYGAKFVSEGHSFPNNYRILTKL
jgi:hypothetical protein